MCADDVDLAQDRELVQAWQAGDLTAFDQLYRRHFDRLTRFCQRRVGDRAVAEEITQDAFVKALEALPRFAGELRFYPWMTVIAGRLCIDHHRRNGRVQTQDEVDPGSVDDGHDERLSLQVDLEHLDRALHRLTDRHAHVLELRERQGLSYDDIAAQLDVPHSTVEALLFRARKALRREFHLVSAERLAGLPVLGWLLRRATRVSNRLTLGGPDLGMLGGTLAAGAMAVVLSAGGAAPATHTVTTTSAGHRTATIATVASTSRAPVAPTASSPPAPAPRSSDPAPGATVMPAGQAREQANQMPVSVDLAQAGVGLNPEPVLSPIVSPAGSNP